MEVATARVECTQVSEFSTGVLPPLRLVSCDLAVWMRALVIVLLVSVAALLFVAIAAARHVWRQRKLAGEQSLPAVTEATMENAAEELDKALK